MNGPVPLVIVQTETDVRLASCIIIRLLIVLIVRNARISRIFIIDIFVRTHQTCLKFAGNLIYS